MMCDICKGIYEEVPTMDKLKSVVAKQLRWNHLHYPSFMFAAVVRDLVDNVTNRKFCGQFIEDKNSPKIYTCALNDIRGRLYKYACSTLADIQNLNREALALLVLVDESES